MNRTASKLPLLCLLFTPSVGAFSQPEVSRRDAWKVGFGVVGGVVYGKIVGDVLFRVSRGIAYPDDHERRVARTIREAAEVAAVGKTLRIVEVGMGSDCRLIRRGLYDEAFAKLADLGVSNVELVGIDLEKPNEKVIQQAKDYLKSSPIKVDFMVLEGDFTDSSSFSTAGSFDVAISCLTMCSVADQESAVERMRDLIRPRGGCLGYIEHVAVDQEEPYHFLEWQQEQLDPLQQAVAHNCHLHRYTEQTIDSVFGVEDADPSSSRVTATRISQERFLVESMWPVSCQACGVIQRNA
jgi:SAM-dependent methyltransferase